MIAGAMRESEALAPFASRLSEEGAFRRGSDGVVMLSGGADSSLLAAVAVHMLGPQAVYAIHLNYGLRPDSNEGEEAARALCAKLRIDLHIERPRLGEGNLQARARDARYQAAEQLRAKLGAEWIATGHSRTDLAETMLYRLAVSPGSRALIGLRPRSGRVIRPLLGFTRARIREGAIAARLPFADDPTNDSLAFARNRIRAEVEPVLSDIGPEFERNAAETHAEMLEEAEFMRDAALRAISASGSAGGAPLRHEELATMAPALRRTVLTILAERASGGRPVRISRSRTASIVRLCADPEGGTIELGRGLVAICEAGTVRFTAEGADRPPEPVRLTIPGRARYGDWEITAQLAREGVVPGGPELATLDAAELGSEVEIRCWREGDRIKPLGLGGTKTLQDLFTDSGVPRSLRSRLPVLVAGERIAWVAGVAVSEDFRLAGSTDRVAVLTARQVA
jgi:tRNA(Ile)-lysidine synthase